MVPREKFNAEKRQLFEYASLLCSDSIRILEASLEAAESGDALQSESVSRQGEHLRALEKLIDDMAARIIALEAPVAGDLRLFITYIKVGSDFERISRHAERLARSGQTVGRGFLRDFLPRIREMVECSVAMLRSIAAAMEDPAYQGLQDIPALDDKVDAIYKELSVQVSARLRQDVSQMEDGMAFLMLLRYLERVGDHATNIAEWIHFAHTGRHIDLND